MSVAPPKPGSGARQHMRAVAVGAALGLISTVFTAVLGEGDDRIYLGILLAGIAWVYLGFAIADGRPSAIVVQAISAAVFLNVAFLGVQLESSVLLGIGFLGHAAWDWVHHDGHGPTHVRTWYPPFCVVADLVIAGPVLAGLV